MADRVQGTRERVLSEIHRLGLDENLIELETQGFTTIRGVLSEGTMTRAREAILARVERKTGHKINNRYKDCGLDGLTDCNC